MWNPTGLWPLFVTALAWSAAAALFWIRPDRAQNRWLALSLLPEPFLFVWGSVFIVFTDDPDSAYAWTQASQVAAALVLFATLRFLATLETPLVIPLRTRAGTIVSALFAIAMGVSFWVVPGAGIEEVTPSAVSTWTVTFGPRFRLVNLPNLLLFLYGLAAVVSEWRRAQPGTASRDRARIFALAFGLRNLGVVALIMWVLFLSGGPLGGEAVVWFLFPIPALLFLVLISYGVLKHQLFDIDLKIQWTLRRVSPIAMLAGVFFLVEESIEFFLPVSGLWPNLAGAAAVGVLLLPVWRAAGRMVERLMPRTSDTSDYRLDRRRRVYQAAFEEAWADRVLSGKDRKVLATLAGQLGLTKMETTRIEATVERKTQDVDVR